MARKYAFLFASLTISIMLMALSPGNADAKAGKHLVAYQSKVGDEYQIFVLDLANPTSPVQLTKGKFSSKHPSLTADGSRIYYYHWTTTNWGDMNLMYYQNMNEKIEKQVQRNAIHEEDDPSISRDGRVLAYRSSQSIKSQFNTENWEIVLLKTDFSEASRITETLNDELSPSLNGNGDTVYFTVAIKKPKPETEEEKKEREMKDKEDEMKAKLKANEEKAEMPFVSYQFFSTQDDFASILMYPGMGGGSSSTPGAAPKAKIDDSNKKKTDEESEKDENTITSYFIFKNSFDGKNLERVTPRDYSAWHPSVDAKERWMVFASNMDGDDEIYLMDLKSFEIKRLTESKGYDGNPVMSSDGDAIVFASDRDGDKEIFMMDRTGGNITQLTNNEIDDDNPSIT